MLILHHLHVVWVAEKRGLRTQILQIRLLFLAAFYAVFNSFVWKRGVWTQILQLCMEMGWVDV